MATKIEFIQPKPRIEDWRVKMNGQTIGSVWRCRDHYIASVKEPVRAPTLDDAFKAAKKQAKSIAAA